MVFINHFIAASNLSYQSMRLQQLRGKKCRKTTNKRIGIEKLNFFYHQEWSDDLSLCLVQWQVDSLQWINKCRARKWDYYCHEAVEKESSLCPSNIFASAQSCIYLWSTANLKDEAHKEELFNCDRSPETETLWLQERVWAAPCHFTGQMHGRELQWVITEVRMAACILPPSPRRAVI